jgi:hypothetical protein
MEKILQTMLEASNNKEIIKGYWENYDEIMARLKRERAHTGKIIWEGRSLIYIHQT